MTVEDFFQRWGKKEFSLSLLFLPLTGDAELNPRSRSRRESEKLSGVVGMTGSLAYRGKVGKAEKFIPPE